MVEIEKWIARLNKHQKIILGIVIPVVLLVIALPIADHVAQVGGSYPGYPFKFQITWWVWLAYLGIGAFAEYKLFENTAK